MRFLTPSIWLLGLIPALAPAPARALELDAIKGLWEGTYTVRDADGKPLPDGPPASIDFIDLKSGALISHIKGSFEPKETLGGLLLRQNLLAPVRNLKVIDAEHIQMTVRALANQKREVDIKAKVAGGEMTFEIPPMGAEPAQLLTLRQVPSSEKSKLTDDQINGSYAGDIYYFNTTKEKSPTLFHVEMILNIHKENAKVELGGHMLYQDLEHPIQRQGIAKVKEVQRIDDRLYFFCESGKEAVEGHMVARIYPDRLSVISYMPNFAGGHGDLKKVDDEKK